MITQGSPVITDARGAKCVQLAPHKIDEKWLQEFLALHPETLPTDKISKLYSGLISVGREIQVPSTKKGKGKIDNLFISKTGHLVVVETKLYKNPESCRDVIGQILDYGIVGMRGWTYETIDAIYRKNHGNKPLFPAMVKNGYSGDEYDLRNDVNTNLQRLEYLLLIVGDTIRESVCDILHASTAGITPGFDIGVCAMNILKGPNEIFVYPQIVTRGEVVQLVRIDMNGLYVGNVAPTANKITTDITLDEFAKAFHAANHSISLDQIAEFIEELGKLTGHGIEIKANIKSLSILCRGITVVQISPKDIKIDIRKLKTHKALSPAVDALVRDLHGAIDRTTRTSCGTPSAYQLKKSVLTHHIDTLINSLTSFSRAIFKLHSRNNIPVIQ